MARSFVLVWGRRHRINAASEAEAAPEAPTAEKNFTSSAAPARKTVQTQTVHSSRESHQRTYYVVASVAGLHISVIGVEIQNQNLAHNFAEARQ